MERKMIAKVKQPWKKQAISKEHRFMFLHKIPFFGIEHPSIDEAAELIVLDRALSGCYPKIVPENIQGDPNIPTLLEKLGREIEIFKERLVSAVASGALKAEPLNINFDDKPITGLCHINSDEIINWLRDRGYEIGDFFREYSRKESQIMNHVCDEIIYRRTVHDSDSEFEDFENENGTKDPKIAKLVHTYKTRMAENLVKNLPKETTNDARLGTRSRNTMLILIEALCKTTNFDIAERGMAKKLHIQTSQLGATIDTKTIRNIFSDIKKAVEDRSKDSWERD
jgi:hypothetical protein